MKKRIHHILIEMILFAKAKDTKNTNDDDKYKEDTSKHQDGNGRVDNPETSDTLRDESVIKTTIE